MATSERSSSNSASSDLSDMHEKARAVALAVSLGGGVANTSEINDRVSFRSNLIGHHADRLIDVGLLADTGRRIDVGPGQDAREYELTDRGKEAVARFRAISEGVTSEARLDALEADVNGLKGEVADIHETVEAIDERLDNLIERFKQA